jgi:hypothetical protein
MCQDRIIGMVRRTKSQSEQILDFGRDNEGFLVTVYTFNLLMSRLLEAAQRQSFYLRE